MSKLFKNRQRTITAALLLKYDFLEKLKTFEAYSV